MPDKNVTTIICGIIQRETIINRNDQLSLDRPGGHALYSASGYLLFDKPVGIVAKVNKDFLDLFGHDLLRKGFDLKGVSISSRPINAQQFYRITSQNEWETTNIKRHFYELGMDVPKFLLRQDFYTKHDSSRLQDEDIILLSSDFPADYQHAQTVVFSPLSLISQSACIPFLRDCGVKTIMIRSSSTYMTPPHLPKIPSLLQGIDIFFTTEAEIRTLFHSRFDRYSEMLALLKKFGASSYVIKNQQGGYLLLQMDSSQVYHIPDFDVVVVDPIGEFDCFCGAFAAVYTKLQIPIEQCAVRASIAAAICREGSGINYILENHPALLRMRTNILQDQIKQFSLSSLHE
jgi:hypothetical protein